MAATKTARKRKKKPTGPRSVFWMKKTDAVWSRVIRHEGVCAVCGRHEGAMHAHHIIGRAFKLHRHNLMNGICLCAGHHVFNATQSAEGNPAWFLEWMETHRPEQFAWVQEHKHDDACSALLDYEASYHSLAAILEAKEQADG